MKILAIETSCDETAVAILEAEGGFENPNFKILGQALYSQASKHAQYGGVYPNLAKREHAENLLPMLTEALRESGDLSEGNLGNLEIDKKQKKFVEEALSRHPETAESLMSFVEKHLVPDVDYIAVTKGPGLEPALWVGISFAKALGELWKKDVVGVNHMEGHIYSVLVDTEEESKLKFPALSLLISGGHTELVLVKDWRDFEILGRTRDDAVGEAFDKTARLMGLSYPGGPEVSKLAESARSRDGSPVLFPRPMIDSGDLDFSFSGLKTAVRQYIENNSPLDENHKEEIALGIEKAIADVLVSKTKSALKEGGAQTLIVAGGVIANSFLRENFKDLAHELKINIAIPTRSLSTDNAVMIAIASYFKYLDSGGDADIIAEGNLKLS